MRADADRFRWLTERMPDPSSRRLVVLTGARQTGKTTLSRRVYPALRYLNLDDPDLRRALAAIPSLRWAADVGAAILDEAQKEPVVFERVKHAFDGGAVDFSVLLGSSRILLMERVRETLAGRAFVFDLWPLTVSELLHPVDARPEPPLLDRLLDPLVDPVTVLRDVPPVLLPDDATRRRDALLHICQWGGMPELLRLSDADRREWLRSYRQTFLERDLADLVRLADLEPFATLQRVCMLRTGRLLSFADLARDAGVSPTTARRYLEYLRMSYQVVLLQPFARNLTSATVKAPKLYWVDAGLQREGTRAWSELDGERFEAVVVTEVHKWVSTMARPVELSFYRTRSGMEVDLLAEVETGVTGFEIKIRERPAAKDLRGLRALAEALGARWRAGIVVHRGDELVEMDAAHRIWAVPAHRLLT